MDYCLTCGKTLQQLANGAFAQCCKGLYGSTERPLPEDRWYPVPYQTWSGVRCNLYSLGRVTCPRVR